MTVVGRLAGFAMLLLFVTWNVFFALVVLEGVGSIGGDLVEAFREGALPLDLAGVLLAVAVAPFCALAAFVPLRRSPWRVAALLFGVEWPLLLGLLVRAFLVHELTPAAGHFFLVFGAGAALLGLGLYRPAWTLSPVWLALHTALLLTAFWFAALLGVYVPAAVEGFFGAVRAGFRGPDSFVLVMFVGMTLGLVAALPISQWLTYVGWFIRGFRGTAATYGTRAAAVATGIGVAAWAIPGVVLHPQPQVEALARLEHAPADEVTRRRLVGDASELRAGLLNAYLASHRYLGADGEVDLVERLYEGHWFAPHLQAGYNLVLSPFLYQGSSLWRDREAADAAYARFFDEPIQRAEKDTILTAMEATWDRDGVEAGLLDVNGEKVHLDHQVVTVTTQGDIARVRIDETYRNRTPDQQEVLYYFSLPESAAVTGLWLTDDPADPTRFPGVLAPRGAAQQVYREQVRTNRDPALLEQVGPASYRLRVFPVLPLSEGVAPPIAVRFEYTVLIGTDGVPLPRLAERRNVFWDEDTVREGGAGEGWLPSHVGAPARPRVHVVDVEGYRLTASPAVPSGLPSGRYALVLDTSYSMRAHEAAVLDAVRLARDGDFDVYRTSGWGGAPAGRFEPGAIDGVEWFGRLDPHELLAQYAGLRGDRTYDAVLVLTDDGTYDFAPERPPSLPETGGPLWLVHVGGALPPAYDDVLLEAIESSGGGVSTSFRDAMVRQGDPTFLDGYRWTWEPAPGNDAVDAALLPLAARRLVVGAGDDLDEAHRIARAAGVVTPFSSYVALVDEAQRRRLAELERRADRFERESESGAAGVTSPLGGLMVSATPEPEEWALLLAGAVLLILHLRHRVALRRCLASPSM